jgi:hypothetical protein
VAPALARARALGKPLLVLVVPEERGQAWWDRAKAFGELLQHASREALLDLALCEVLCATRSDLARHVPAAAGLADAPLALVDVDGTLTAARDDLPPGPERPRGRMLAGEVRAEYTAAVLARVAEVELRIRELVAPDADALARREVTAARSLDPAVLERIAVAYAGGPALDPREADDGAAVVRSLLRPGVEEREHVAELRASLIAGTTWRLREGPPLGARWQSTLGCGSHIEDLPDGHPAALEGGRSRGSGFGCGMAHVPEASRRFLSFWGDTKWA